MKDFVILIPSYKPDEHLGSVIDDLMSGGFSRFVVINDGSGMEYERYFSAAVEKEGVTLLSHEVNRGKGAALKTGLSFVAEKMADASFVLTVDADGQHRLADVLKVAERASREQSAMVLGSRNFSLPQVPFRSRFGNRLTSFIFRISGARIQDTQTGLRAIPVKNIAELVEISGERYEYETNVLLHLKDLGIPVCEEEIETVYLNENEGSHFNPVKDSLRIYRLIFRYWAHCLVRVLKFSASSLLCTLVDFLAFFFLHFYFAASFGVLAEIICQAIARAASSVLNFFINRNVVFARKRGKTGRLMLRYYAISIPQLLLSGIALNALTQMLSVQQSSRVTLLKVAVDLVFFFISYRLQRDWVFGKEKGDKKPCKE